MLEIKLPFHRIAMVIILCSLYLLAQLQPRRSDITLRFGSALTFLCRINRSKLKLRRC